MRSTAVLVLFAALHMLFFGDVLIGGRSLSPATYVAGITPSGPFGAPSARRVPHLLDPEGAAWVDEPSPLLAARALRAGRLPLWNETEGLGAPLAANLNSGAANPLHLALNLWPGPWTADLFYLGRLLALALFTWLYLRRLTLSPVAAVLGAVVAAYGGYAMAWIAHHALSVELLLPLMLASLEHGRRGHLRGWVWLALAAAGAMLGGKLQATLLCFGFVVAYATLRGRRATGGIGAPTVLLHAGVAIVVGTALAGFLLVPAAELMSRASGLTLGGRSALASFTHPWPALASVAVPGLFVPPGASWPAGLPLPPAVGVVATVLVAIGLAARRSPLRGVACFFALWATALLLRNAGLAGGELVGRVPVLGAILFLKYTFTAAFALACGAAIGLDAVARGLVDPWRATRAGTVALVTVVLLAGAASLGTGLPTFPDRLVVPAAVAALTLAIALAWRAWRPAPGVVAVLLSVSTVLELRLLAPWDHPVRLDPYRAPPHVEFLRRETPGRIIAGDGLLVPLTGAAAGLRDVRAINVLTPGDSYAFFVRLLSFCPRVIHFTADPDLALAATAPALDLVGVRYVVSQGPLALDDLAIRVRRQVGRERVGRLLAGLRGLRTTPGALALGPVAVGGEERFAFTLETPFVFEIEAESAAAELAWGASVDTGTPRITWSVGTPDGTRTGVIDDLEAGGSWRDVRIELGAAGRPRRVRVRLEGRGGPGGGGIRVSLGNFGFTDGVAAEPDLARRRIAAHTREAGALVPVFRDVETGVVVYENRNALPRAFRVGAVVPVDSVEEALSRLGAGFDFRRAVLVRSADAAALTAALESSPAAREEWTAAREQSRGATRILRDEPTRVTLTTDGGTAAVLVLTDLVYPGWRATVDGAAAPVFEVNGVLRGVLVPPGPHTVEFRYRPSAWGVGVLLSVVGVVLLVGLGRLGASSPAVR